MLGINRLKPQGTMILTLSGYLASEEHNKYICSEPNPEKHVHAQEHLWIGLRPLRGRH
jgi:hypothetical protein